MRIHALIHAPFEKLGIIEQWIAQHQHPLTTTHTYRGEALPAVNQFDFLIIMGGPQSPLQLEQYPYLRDEMMLTAETIREHKPVLGICLGAQIIGQALGANTEQSPQREIGVYPIQLTPAAAQDPVFANFPAEFDVMHWHNDMPGLPPDSVLLASSAGCPRQAFRYGDRVYGLQFHLEMTAELVAGMLTHCANDLTPGKFIRSKTELQHTNYADINQKILTLLDYLAARVESPTTNTRKSSILQ